MLLLRQTRSERAYFSLCVPNETFDDEIKGWFALTDKRIRDKLHRLWSPQRAMSEREAGHTALGVTDAHCLPVSCCTETRGGEFANPTTARKGGLRHSRGVTFDLF